MLSVVCPNKMYADSFDLIIVQEANNKPHGPFTRRIFKLVLGIGHKITINYRNTLAD